MPSNESIVATIMEWVQDRNGRLVNEWWSSITGASMTVAEFLATPPTSVVLYPNEILRRTCKPILLEDTVKDEIRRVVDVMFDLMYQHKGCGLAAPQVGLDISLFVVNPTGDRDRKDKEKVFINPSIFHYGPRTTSEVEGCLSLPGCTAVIDRPRKIMGKATHLDGTEEKFCYEGLMSRICQHEYNHLQGTLIIDMMSMVDAKRVRPVLDRLETIARTRSANDRASA